MYTYDLSLYYTSLLVCTYMIHCVLACLVLGRTLVIKFGFRLRSAWHGWKGCKFLPSSYVQAADIAQHRIDNRIGQFWSHSGSAWRCKPFQRRL